MDAETEKMLGDGSLYDPNLPELAGVQMQCLEKLFDYNATRPGEAGKRAALLRGMFAEIGEDCYIEPPLRSNWGGRHVHFGSGIYANFNLTLVDDADIFVGDEVMFGPNVTLVTAAHPVDPGLRRQGYEYNLPVRIGSGVWLGAGATVLPGVTIGENAVIGAGSVVTKDVPPNVVAFGVPARVVRPIGPSDREYYRKGAKTDPKFL